MLHPQVANSPNTTSATHSYTELYMNWSIIVCYSRWALFPHTSLFWDPCICVCVLVFWAKLRQGVCVRNEWRRNFSRTDSYLPWRWRDREVCIVWFRDKCKEGKINRQKKWRREKLKEWRESGKGGSRVSGSPGVEFHHNASLVVERRRLDADRQASQCRHKQTHTKASLALVPYVCPSA